MARTYKRDARGRFAGGGGGSGGGRKSAKPVTLPARKPGGKSSGGHLLKRQAVKDAKAKLAKMDSADRSYSGTLRRRAQKAAVTRASNALKAAKQGGKVRLSGRSGVLRPGGKKAAPVATPAAAKAKARPAGGRKISSAKAERIVARIDANRPGLRRASGSNRRTANALRTHDRASDFILAASKRSIKRGKGPLGTVESTKRAVANATKSQKPRTVTSRRKPKTANDLLTQVTRI